MATIIIKERTESLTEPPAGLELLRDVEFGRNGESPLSMHILQPRDPSATPMPVIVGIHGSAWTWGSRDWCLETLLHFATRGYFTVTVGHRYRTEAPFPSMIEDCKCAVRYLRAHADQYRIDSGRIGAWSRSGRGSRHAPTATWRLGLPAESRGARSTPWRRGLPPVESVNPVTGAAQLPRSIRVTASSMLIGGSTWPSPTEAQSRFHNCRTAIRPMFSLSTRMVVRAGNVCALNSVSSNPMMLI